MENYKIQKETRNSLIDDLLNTDIFGRLSDGNEVSIDFLNRIWKLKELTSTDSRFKDAEGDIYQHMINNSDWELSFLLKNYLGLLEGDDSLFISFLENIVHPEVRNGVEDIKEFVYTINFQLEKSETSVSLKIDNIIDGIPIYLIKENSIPDYLEDAVLDNDVNFYVVNRGSFPLKDYTYPCVLLHKDNWDDFGYKTIFGFYYYRSRTDYIDIGGVKILNKNDDTTADIIPLRFTQLGSDYCSLCESVDFYNTLKDFAGDNFMKVLHGLNDVAFYPLIAEDFEDYTGFKFSLLRFSDYEKAYNQARKSLNGYKLDEDYEFSFECIIGDNFIPHKVDFSFSQTKKIPSRIYAIIGKNGTGKTQYLSKVALSLSGVDEQKRDEVNTNKFFPSRPLFSKVITVSYSIFDNFKIPEKNRLFSYVYCGLKDKKGNFNEREIEKRFIKSMKLIYDKHLFKRWRKIIRIVVPEIFLLHDFKDNEELSDNKVFQKLKSVMSSGQSILLYVLTEIIANIRSDSLILFDEPEMHLHPNAISHIVRMLDELLDEFDSYAIIATHSPIIIQEIPSECVRIFERNEDIPIIRQPNFECFGENLTTITKDIFGTREIKATYKAVFAELARTMSFEEIELLFKNRLSLNAKIFLNSLYKESEDED